MLGPCIVNNSFPSFHWIYWVGPITGVILAVIIYKLVKALEYETAQEKDDNYGKPQPRTEFRGKVRAERQSTSILPMTEDLRSATMMAASEAQGVVVTITPPASQAIGEKKLQSENGDEKLEKPEAKKGDDEEQVLPDCYAD